MVRVQDGVVVGERLPSYLHRFGVDVIWRTNNWGEPPIRVDTFERARDLRENCDGAGCGFDEVLLRGLLERIRSSAKPKVLVVLHQRGSHGPTPRGRIEEQAHHSHDNVFHSVLGAFDAHSETYHACLDVFSAQAGAGCG